MGNKKSKKSSKRCKSKKCRETKSEKNISQQEEKKTENEYVEETIVQDSVDDKEIDSDIHTDSNTSTSETSTDTGSEANTDDTSNINDINDYCEEIKEKQQELLNKLKNITEALAAITLIRDNVNFIKVDNLTELYFTRQVRPLLDALNIISFAVNNMTTAAQNIQINTFGDRKEIRHALNLSYKMNDEVEDIIDSLGRRLTIFLKQVDNMDKNCPPFNFGKDS